MQTLFKAGSEGIASFRIPSLLPLPGGRVLAFCEARFESSMDCGHIALVLRISADGGKTFSPIRMVCQMGADTVGNPCPVYDRDTGEVFVVFNGNRRDGPEDKVLRGQAARSVWIAQSGDLGESWSAPRDITRDTKKTGWTWYATGPCHGIQMKNGRLVLGCNHAVLNAGETASGPYISHAIFSDDHGRTWQCGGDVGENTNECSVQELSDGRLYINMRSYAGKGCRAEAYSADGGSTWTHPRLNGALPDSVCQGSTLALDGGARLLFCNAADAKERIRLTLRESRDFGETWSAGQLIWPGPSAYSDLCLLPDGTIGCLFECGETSPYEEIRFAAVSQDRLG